MNNYYKRLTALVSKSKSLDQMRFGQRLYNAIASHDRPFSKDYQEDFHRRLFYIEDQELINILMEYENEEIASSR